MRACCARADHLNLLGQVDNPTNLMLACLRTLCTLLQMKQQIFCCIAMRHLFRAVNWAFTRAEVTGCLLLSVWLALWQEGHVRVPPSFSQAKIL